MGTSIGISNDISPKKNGDVAPLKMRVISNDENGDVAYDIDKRIGDLFIPPSREKKHDDRICSAGARMISINPYGKVYPCVSFPLCIGDATAQSLESIWMNSVELNNWRRQNVLSNRKDCIACAHLKYCRFCPGEAMLYTGDPVSKYQDACFVTENKKHYSEMREQC